MSFHGYDRYSFSSGFAYIYIIRVRERSVYQQGIKKLIRVRSFPTILWMIYRIIKRVFVLYKFYLLPRINK